MYFRIFISAFLMPLLCNLALLPPARAQSIEYSTALYGPLGLNTIPNARVDPVGTIRAQLSTLDPYLHGSLGFQIATPLYISIRQSAETGDLNDDADRLYPGIDAKLRLLNERAYMPEIAIGLQSAIGHKRMAGEYVALSKRYNSFDFTAGLGWGRFAGSAQFDNPLGLIGNHFDDPRAIDGEQPGTIENWFTGERVGLMAGVEYFTPYAGLSLKADYGGDRFEAEKAAFGFDAPSPWSIGLNYKPSFAPFADIGIATQGTDKIMGRISLQTLAQDWRHQSAQLAQPESKLRPYRTDLTLPVQMESKAQHDKIALSYAYADLKTANAQLKLNPHHSTPLQLGRSAAHMANHAGPVIEEIKISPTSYGLRGPSIAMNRRDLESALAHQNGSAEEIWHNTEIKHDFKGIQRIRPVEHRDFYYKDIHLTLENQISLSEEDNGTAYRSSLIAHTTGPHINSYFTNGFGVRLNIADNLDDLDEIRPPKLLPVRSDVDEFVESSLSIEHAYIALPHTLAPDVHTILTAGYLEEMYAGFGGEILYRPFDKRFAIGAESWLALKRDPDAFMNYGLNGDHLLTAHINGRYDIPRADVTIGLKAGRYLAEDIGFTASLQKNFKNGAILQGHITVSDQADFDAFGGTTHADHGIRLTLPLGGYKYAPSTDIRLITAPLGRDIGQSIQSPLPLYDLTTPLTAAHIIQHWDEITD